MSETPSTMLPLGTKAPYFDLPDIVSDEKITLNSFSNKKALLVMFICKHCPYVQHVEHELARMGKDYTNKDLGIIAISANDVKVYPEDGPIGMKEQAERLGFNFPYLYDEDQSVAKTYTAACTPDLFLFDENRELVYRGQLDESRPGNSIPVTGENLRDAIDAVLEAKEISQDQKPSSGCNIKWKSGNEPSYYKSSI